VTRLASATFVPALAFALAVSIVCPSVARADVVHLLGVDRDDDDVDGRVDAEQDVVSFSNDLFEVPLPSGSERSVVVRGDAVRVLVDGKPLVGERVPAGVRRVWVQAVRPGRGEVDAFGTTFHFAAIDVRPVDGQDKYVDPTRSHASFERIPPERLTGSPYAKNDNGDALRFVLVGLPADLPPLVRLVGRDPSGATIDVLDSVSFGSVPCPDGSPAAFACGSTSPIRMVPDEIDRHHPVAVNRSLRAVLGGVVEVVVDGVWGEGRRRQSAAPNVQPERKLGAVRVGGPRVTPLGPIVRYRGRLRVFLVRQTVGGPPPLGTDDAGALHLARAEVARASALWAACGTGFGPPSDLDVSIVDPPRGHLVALGCDHGLSAAGGGNVRVRLDGRDVSIAIDRGVTPAGAARVLAAAMTKAGFVARVSDNAVIGAGVRGSSDVLVRRRSGELALVEPPASGPVSSDARLMACIGRVDLEDGLQHFGDVDAIAGTVEERALIKAFDDGDPTTIEVYIVPSFASGGRIGESFIGADGGAVRNVLIEDRAAFRADRASFALAHELGHVLLDEPGHPDDFGRDTPSRLMDADAANGTAFGPRRLLVEECVRALRQSGPSAPVSLLRPWPFSVLGKER